MSHPAGAGLVPLHPERTDAPAALRWSTPAGVLPFVGPVAEAPGPLGRLLRDGVLDAVVVEAAAVVTVLGESRDWRDHGAEVRAALHAALADPASWRAAAGADLPDADAPLRRAVETVLDGSFGAFVRGHGGSVRLLDVTDGVVRVALEGACRGCPAAALTVHLRFERELRARDAGLAGVVVAEVAPVG